MIDLCIDARMSSQGGIGTFLKHLTPSLQRAPFRTQLLTNPIPIYSLQEQWRLPLCIPSCDLFWSPHYNIPLLPIRAKKRVVTVHDVCHLALPNFLQRKERFYAHTMLRQAVKRSDLVLTVSQFSRQELCKYLNLSPDTIQVIYPGIDFERFARKQQATTIREKYQLPSTFFLFVGNIKPHKNLQVIFEAYERSSIDVPLVIVGRVKGLIHPDTRILNKKAIFLEEVSDEELPSFYQMAKALLFPSLYEGFGFPPLEAMAASCPVIASRCASIPEVCGDGAYYINPTSAEELVTAMHTVEDWKTSLIQKGRLQARKFSWERTIREYTSAFQGLV